MKRIYKPWFSSSMDGFKADLTDSAFTIFEPLSDHGYFTWKAEADKSKYRNVKTIRNAKLFTDRIVLDGLPKELVPYDSLKFPHRFETLPAQRFFSVFPHSGFLAGSLHVATRYRGVVLDQLDFVLGGAALGFLAAKLNSNKPQVVFRIPNTSGGNTIGIQNFRRYTQDYTGPGFQFERFVTGTEFDPTAPIEFINHIHQMKIGSHRALLVNQTDALYQGEPVEIKSMSKYQTEIQILFQLVSCGSRWLCLAKKDDTYIKSARLVHFSEVMYRTLLRKDRARFEENILYCLDAIQDQMSSAEENEVFDLTFEDEKVQLKLNTKEFVFPRKKVTRELLHCPPDVTESDEPERLLQIE